MRMVFEKFESSLELRRDALNVVRIEDPSLFARCALSLAQGFPADALEPAFFFSDSGKEVKAAKILYFVGDVLQIDLNDKRIVSQVLKTLVERLAVEGRAIQDLEKLSCQMEEVFEEQFVQMSANYQLADDWDAAKCLKMLGLGVDDSEDITVYDRLQHYIRVMADLFPDKVIALVNLPVYLTEGQYDAFCELVVSLQLCVLSYEQGKETGLRHLDNMLYVDANYLER